MTLVRSYPVTERFKPRNARELVRLDRLLERQVVTGMQVAFSPHRGHPVLRAHLLRGPCPMDQTLEMMRDTDFFTMWGNTIQLVRIQGGDPGSPPDTDVPVERLENVWIFPDENQLPTFWTIEWALAKLEEPGEKQEWKHPKRVVFAARRGEIVMGEVVER